MVVVYTEDRGSNPRLWSVIFPHSILHLYSTVKFIPQQWNVFFFHDYWQPRFCAHWRLHRVINKPTLHVTNDTVKSPDISYWLGRESIRLFNDVKRLWSVFKTPRPFYTPNLLKLRCNTKDVPHPNDVTGQIIGFRSAVATSEWILPLLYNHGHLFRLYERRESNFKLGIWFWCHFICSKTSAGPVCSIYRRSSPQGGLLFPLL